MWETNRPKHYGLTRLVPPKPPLAREKPGVAFSSARPWYVVMEEEKAAERAKRPLLLGQLGQAREFEPDVWDDIAPEES